jgi:heme-degrading monooxygenase HmoA
MHSQALKLQPHPRGGTCHGQALGKQRRQADPWQALDAVQQHARSILDEQQRPLEERRAATAAHRLGLALRIARGRSAQDGRAQPMMTIVTRVTLKEGREPQWDAAMTQRLESAKRQRGWIGGQLVIPLDGPNSRVIIGTWESRADWEAWHTDPAFRDTREQMQGLEAKASEEWWHEVVADVRRAA